MTLIEKDNSLFKNLKKSFLIIIILNYTMMIFLNINIEKLIKKETIIFGNLPYNISSQILVKFLRFKNGLQNLMTSY